MEFISSLNVFFGSIVILKSLTYSHFFPYNITYKRKKCVHEVSRKILKKSNIKLHLQALCTNTNFERFKLKLLLRIEINVE